MYVNGHQSLFSPEELATCIPPWRSVTGGGCPTDLLALDHLFGVVYPIINKDQVPMNLRFECNCKEASQALTATPVPCAKGTEYSSLGCQPDDFLLRIEMLTDKMASSSKTLKQILRDHRDSQDRSSPLGKLNSNQLLILYTWRHPTECLRLYSNTFYSKKKIKFFNPGHLLFLKPLLSAFKGGPLPDPPALQEHKRERYMINGAFRYRKLLEVLPTAHPAMQKRIKASMAKIRRNQSLSHQEMVAAAETVNLVEQLDSSDTESSDKSDTESMSCDPTCPGTDNVLIIDAPLDMSAEEIIQNPKF